jgi:hypothetical protein
MPHPHCILPPAPNTSIDTTLSAETARTKTLYIDFELMKFDFEQRMARIRAVKDVGNCDNIRRIGLRGHHLNEALRRELIKIVKMTDLNTSSSIQSTNCSPEKMKARPVMFLWSCVISKP